MGKWDTDARTERTKYHTYSLRDHGTVPMSILATVLLMPSAPITRSASRVSPEASDTETLGKEKGRETLQSSSS
jgi:hypothetical protein